MGSATFSQTSFLGGEWSKSMQGRTTDPRYKAALSRCLNFIPLEEGALTRRPGMEYVNTTRGGAAGRLIRFNAAEGASYAMEFTDIRLRMLNGFDGVVFRDDQVSVTSISNATPAILTIPSDKGWVSGDQIEFFISTDAAAAAYPDQYNLLKQRKFAVLRTSGTTYILKDGTTFADIVGTDINTPAPTVGLVAASVFCLATPWSPAQVATIRSVQNQDSALLLTPDQLPYVFTFVAQDFVGTGKLAQATFLDGPYMDIDTTGAYLSPVTTDPSAPNLIDVNVYYPTYDANTSYSIGQVVTYSGQGYKAKITLGNKGKTPVSQPTYWQAVGYSVLSGRLLEELVGRCIRLLTEPADWNIATTYATNDAVKYGTEYFISIADGNLAAQPDNDTAKWLPTTSTNVSRWTWGRVLGYTGAYTGLHVEIMGDPLIYTSEFTGNVFITAFRLGIYGWYYDDLDNLVNQFPTCGVYHQGRLWLGGAVKNRFDASNSNDFFNFAPTGIDGTVADNNSIAAILNAQEVNDVFWMESTSNGIISGTSGGEWLIHASVLNDPISPTNIQAHQITNYKCADIAPVKAGVALLFVQVFKRKLFEMLSGARADQYSANNISAAARHFTKGNIAEIAYQEEPIPIIWVRKEDGTLCGCTYRRTSPFASEEPNFAAWFDVDLGSDLTVESVCVIPGLTVVNEAAGEALAAVVHSATTGLRYVVLLTPPREETDTIYNAWFLDNARAPKNMLVTTSGGNSGLRAYGLWHLNGLTVSGFIGGLNCGTAAVSNGSAFFAFGTDPDGAFTLANMQALSALGLDFDKAEATFSAGSGATAYTIPAIFGHTYTSIGQALRPAAPEDSGARNGPAAGKTRRSDQITAQFLNTVSGIVSVGTDAAHLRPVTFRSSGGTAYTKSQLFTGIWRDTVDDDYSFDSMLYWQVSLPYPATVLQIGAFIQTQD